MKCDPPCCPGPAQHPGGQQHRDRDEHAARGSQHRPPAVTLGAKTSEPGGARSSWGILTVGGPPPARLPPVETSAAQTRLLVKYYHPQRTDYSSPRTVPKRAQRRRIPAASAHLGPALCEDSVLTVNQNKSLWQLWAAPPPVWTTENRAWFSGRVTRCSLHAPAVAALGELRLCGERMQMQEDALGGRGWALQGKLLRAARKLKPTQTSHGVFVIYYFKPINKL